MHKVRLREVSQLTESHTTRDWQNEDVNWGVWYITNH
jgi:hypothetical protein